MTAHVLLNLLNELGKKIRCETLPSTFSVSPTSLLNSIIQAHECKIFITEISPYKSNPRFAPNI